MWKPDPSIPKWPSSICSSKLLQFPVRSAEVTIMCTQQWISSRWLPIEQHHISSEVSLQYHLDTFFYVFAPIPQIYISKPLCGNHQVWKFHPFQYTNLCVSSVFSYMISVAAGIPSVAALPTVATPTCSIFSWDRRCSNSTWRNGSISRNQLASGFANPAGPLRGPQLYLPRFLMVFFGQGDVSF